MISTPAFIWYKMPLVAPVPRQPSDDVMIEKKAVQVEKRKKLFWYAVLRYNAPLVTTDGGKRNIDELWYPCAVRKV